MNYAQIKDGVIKNIIVADENTPLELFSDGFDFFLRVDELDPEPGVGWSYDGVSFTAPPPLSAPVKLYPKLDADPDISDSTEAQVYFNTTTGKFRGFNGTAWVDLG